MPVFVGLYVLVGITATIVVMRRAAKDDDTGDEDPVVVGLVFVGCVAIWPLGALLGMFWALGKLVTRAVRPTRR